jgi:hypothetical protein
MSPNWVEVLILASFHLESVSGLLQFYNESDKGSSHQILCKSLKKHDGDPGTDQTSVQAREHELYTGV